MSYIDEKVQCSQQLCIEVCCVCLPKGCRVEGTVHATDAAWEGIWQDSNQLVEAHEPRDLPPESGPFVFVPNRFTRKQ